MNLASIYYVVGIICLIIDTFLLVVTAILLIYIWRRFVSVQKRIEEIFDEVKSRIKHPRETASDLGAAAASSMIHKVADIIRGDNSK